MSAIAINPKTAELLVGSGGEEVALLATDTLTLTLTLALTLPLPLPLPLAFALTLALPLPLPLPLALALALALAFEVSRVQIELCSYSSLPNSRPAKLALL